jgi:hypothetical protein
MGTQIFAQFRTHQKAGFAPTQLAPMLCHLALEVGLAMEHRSYLTSREVEIWNLWQCTAKHVEIHVTFHFGMVFRSAREPCWKSRLQLKGSNHKESYEGTQLGQIKYIVNCVEQTTEGIQATYRVYK